VQTFAHGINASGEEYMNENIRCPDCDAEMEKGFIPDNAHGAVLQAHWQQGEPDKNKFLGLDAGIKVKKDLMRPITCFRCSDCGLLKYYAV
jgi:hypothetical protein